MFKNLRQSILVLVVVTSFLAFSFAASAENAQTSKKSAEPTPKKASKATPSPTKKTQAKTAPTPSKSSATAKSKTADKKSPVSKNDSKSQSAKDKAKNGKDVKTRDVKSASAKNSASSKSKEKVSAKTDSKAKDSKSAKTSKTAMTAKTASTKKTETSKKPIAKVAAKPKPKVEETTETAELPQIMVTDVSVPIRASARAGAPELSRAKLGTVLDVSQKSASWYKVQFSNGAKTSVGWIPANSVGNLDAADKARTYNLIANRYYKPDGMDFATASALYESLTRNQSDFESSDSAADLQLKRLLALRAALKAIPAGSKDSAPYKDFLKARDKEIVYSEPSGQFLVASNLFWDLHKKYKGAPVSEQIAWEGAQNPLPGECEGYVNCHLFYARMTSGEYLNLHPTGKRSLEALTNLTNTLTPIVADLNAKQIYNGPTDVTDRAEFNNLLAELRTIVSRLPLTEKEKTLQQLKSIAEGFR